MTPAIASMLGKYSLESADDYTNALREIFQEIALCGLWRSKFFEHAAFYGGTALRILHGLQRFSEDMDFSLNAPDTHFDLSPHYKAIREELEAWGFLVEIQKKTKAKGSVIESAFVKANTRAQFLVIEDPRTLVQTIHAERKLSIKVEIDTDPPPGFKNRDAVPSCPHTLLGQGLRLTLSFRRQDACGALQTMEEPHQRP